MLSQRNSGLLLLCLVASSCVVSTFGIDAPEERKFAAKPNNKIKYADRQIPSSEDHTNELIQEDKEDPTSGGMLGSVLGLAMQLLIGGPKSGPGASDKMETISALTRGELSWTEMFSLGLDLFLSFVNGDGAVDRVDNGSPLEGILATAISFFTGNDDPSEVNVMAKQASELFGLVMVLLDTLQTSFSSRSYEARMIGTTDPMADAAVAATTMFKSYIRSYNTEDDLCVQRYLCEANKVCVDSTGDSGYLFCQIGTYAMSYGLEHTTYTPFEIFNDAGRRGRVGEECHKIFSECNEV